MYYKVLKIKQVSDNYYDVDLEEIRWFRKPKVLKEVRFEHSSILAVRVSDNKYFFNFKEILKAYDCIDIDFTKRKEDLPKINSL